MLQLKDLEYLLGRITYKPGWKLSVYETDSQGIWFKVRAIVEDAYSPENKVELNIKSPLPPMKSDEDFYRWIRWRLEVIEVHECHEWLRWKDEGGPLWDPHADGADEPSGTIVLS